MKEETTLQDFCNFIEKEIGISMSNENWKIYHQQKQFALINERNQMVDAYYAGINASHSVRPKEGKDYLNEKYGELSIST